MPRKREMLSESERGEPKSLKAQDDSCLAQEQDQDDLKADFLINTDGCLALGAELDKRDKGDKEVPEQRQEKKVIAPSVCRQPILD